MSDDQDGYEWVSVSSGTGRALTDQRPLNGCVCVCLSLQCPLMLILTVKCSLWRGLQMD